MSPSQPIGRWAGARLFGTAATVAWFVWRRGMPSTIGVGIGTMLILRLGLGW